MKNTIHGLTELYSRGCQNASDLISKGGPTFSTVLGEIFNNINNHAGKSGDIASAIMQHFPKRSEVDIAISDFGEGIPARVREKEPEISNDGAAILKAVEENFSTRSTPRNRGAAGLTYIRTW